MSEEKKGVLNLDELFGQARAVIVRWQGRDYELLRIEGISPRQATQFNKLYLQAGGLQKALAGNGDVDEEQAVEIDELFSKMIRILCADFPVGETPFLAKMRIIQFYMEQTQGKKAMETALKTLTGEMSSRG